jgi:hypothetical protein
MKPIHKNIINKLLKLHFYNFDTNKSNEKEDLCFVNNVYLYFKSSNDFIKIIFVKNFNGSCISYFIDYEKNIYPNEILQIVAVQKNKNNIKSLIDYNRKFIPSEKVQLAAVNTWECIRHIKNPSEKVQLAAVKRNYEAIIHIINPYLSVIELYEKLSGKKYEKKYL